MRGHFDWLCWEWRIRNEEYRIAAAATMMATSIKFFLNEQKYRFCHTPYLDCCCCCWLNHLSGDWPTRGGQKIHSASEESVVVVVVVWMKSKVTVQGLHLSMWLMTAGYRFIASGSFVETATTATRNYFGSWLVDLGTMCTAKGRTVEDEQGVINCIINSLTFYLQLDGGGGD